MGFWGNPLNKAWRSIPKGARTGLGIAAGGLGIGLTGGLLSGLAGSATGAGISAALANFSANTAIPLASALETYRQGSIAQDWAKQTYREQLHREDTAYTRRMADLKAAGLSPALAYGAGGAPTSAGGNDIPEIRLDSQPFTAAQQVLLGKAQLAQQYQLQQAQIQQLQAVTEGTKIDNNKKTFSLAMDWVYEFAERQSGLDSAEVRRQVDDSQRILNETHERVTAGNYADAHEAHGLRMVHDLMQFGMEARDWNIMRAANIMYKHPAGQIGTVINGFLAAQRIGGKTYDIPADIQWALTYLYGKRLIDENGRWQFYGKVPFAGPSGLLPEPSGKGLTKEEERAMLNKAGSSWEAYTGGKK